MALRDGLDLLARTAKLGRGQRIETRRYWATVVAGAGAVHVVLDADPSGAAREVSANAVGAVALGDRVQVEMRGRRLTVVQSPISDTGWQPLELMSGFTGGTGDFAPQWRVRDGRAMLRGRVARDAGNWTGAATQFAVTPVGARPTRLLYTVAVARGGYVLTAAIDDRLLIASAAATAEVHLESIPPWRVD